MDTPDTERRKAAAHATAAEPFRRDSALWRASLLLVVLFRALAGIAQAAVT